MLVNNMYRFPISIKSYRIGALQSKPFDEVTMSDLIKPFCVNIHCFLSVSLSVPSTYLRQP